MSKLENTCVLARRHMCPGWVTLVHLGHFSFCNSMLEGGHGTLTPENEQTSCNRPRISSVNCIHTPLCRECSLLKSRRLLAVANVHDEDNDDNDDDDANDNSEYGIWNTCALRSGRCTWPRVFFVFVNTRKTGTTEKCFEIV